MTRRLRFSPERADHLGPDFSEQNWKAFLKVAIDENSATEIAEELGVNAQAILQANYRIHRRVRLVLQDLIE